MTQLDERDTAILNKRQALYDQRPDPMQGDFIIFADGSEARITHVWTDENNKPRGIQTSNTAENSGYYLGDGFMSYSGSLNDSIPWKYFIRTNERRFGNVWFFHHDYATAGGGIYTQLNCKVWRCSKINRTHENWKKGLWKVGDLDELEKVQA